MLVLSEFAGSAQSLSGAIRINPWNTEEVRASRGLFGTAPIHTPHPLSTHARRSPPSSYLSTTTRCARPSSRR